MTQNHQTTAHRWLPLGEIPSSNVYLAGLVVFFATAVTNLRAESRPFLSEGASTLPALKEAYKESFLVGTAMGPELVGDPRVCDLVASQFNAVTATNQMKPALTEPRERQFTFAEADKLVDFAQDHGLKVIGHTLVWRNQTPDWFFRDETGRLTSRDSALSHMKEHIRAVMGRYRGRVLGWDVVNEALAQERGLMFDPQSLWMKTVGPDYVEKAFEFAHEADPNAELYYNDNGIERPGKLEKAVELIKRLKAKGLRVDAIGIQGHWGSNPPIKDLENAIVQFKAAGVKVMITELDLSVLPALKEGMAAAQKSQWAIPPDPYTAGCPSDILASQAKNYGALFQMLMKHRDVVTRVTFWGVSDKDSWRNNWPIKGRTDYPLLFDRSLQPKPAFQSVIEAAKAGT